MIIGQEEISRRLNVKGYRPTKQRLAVLKVLQGTKSHPDANWIYEKVRKEIPHVSLGTIYRTLSILKEAGLLLELNYGSSQNRYDGNTESHYHIVCINCRRIDDLELPLANELERQVKGVTDFTVTGHRLEFYGLCPDCRPG
ncbi:MAG: Fur family transcriptional regulator [Anaerolineae bacterium]